MTFARPINDRYFEDYVEGDIHRFGTISVEADELIAFAKRFDPQAMHTDPEAAKNTPFGGLIASGWHTAGLMMRALRRALPNPRGEPGLARPRRAALAQAGARRGYAVGARDRAQDRPLKIQARSGRGYLIRRGHQPGRRDRDDVQGRQHHRQAAIGVDCGGHFQSEASGHRGPRPSREGEVRPEKVRGGSLS